MAKRGDDAASKRGVSADRGGIAAGRDVKINARSTSKRK